MKYKELSKELTKILNKAIKKDNKELNLVCIKKDKNGNKTYTRKSKRNKIYLEHINKQIIK
tara:strand:- start:98 stop:280 length:183 start_codon:yes stop_codon:yes gene_type:complete